MNIIGTCTTLQAEVLDYFARNIDAVNVLLASRCWYHPPVAWLDIGTPNLRNFLVSLHHFVLLIDMEDGHGAMQGLDQVLRTQTDWPNLELRFNGLTGGKESKDLKDSVFKEIGLEITSEYEDLWVCGTHTIRYVYKLGNRMNGCVIRSI